MTEKISTKAAKLRELVNSQFYLGFNEKLIRENERGVTTLEEDCLTEDGFVFLIGTLATLVDDFDGAVLRSCLKGEYANEGSVNLLEKFLEENNLKKGNIINNLRKVKKIRNTVFPFHRGTSRKFVNLMRELSFEPPFELSAIWEKCLDMYLNSLDEFLAQLNEYNFRIEYRKEIREEIAKSAKDESVIYLNDFLYKYRVLVPTKYKYEMETLVDYLTAAIIAYDRKLKSIDYALRKYVIPLKDKFREHVEDIYFIKKRRFTSFKNELFRGYGIILSRDDIGIEDDKDFDRYVRYVYASLVAYHAGMKPDSLIRYYWGSSWLG